MRKLILVMPLLATSFGMGQTYSYNFKGNTLGMSITDFKATEEGLTLRDIAKRCRVSKTTVIRALK